MNGMSFFTSILLLERYFLRPCRQRRACTLHGSNVAKTRLSRVSHLLQIAIAGGRSRRAAWLPEPAASLAGRAIPSDESGRDATIGQSYRMRHARRTRARNERLQI
ncbi:Secreted protein [Burkholderia sp. IT-111MI5]